MKKLLIKNVQTFCNLSESLAGEDTLHPEQWAGPKEHSDVRFQYENLHITYSFTGSCVQEENTVTGSWLAKVPVKCVKCNEKIELTLKEEYNNLALVDSRKDQKLDLYEVIECWAMNFDLMPWLISEIILQIPIAPQHTDAQCVKQQAERKKQDTLQNKNSFSNILKYYENNS